MVFIDINISLKIPSEYVPSGSECFMFKKFLNKLSGVCFSESEYYHTCEHGDEVIVFSFSFIDCSNFLKKEQLKQIECIQNELLKLWGLELHSLCLPGRKNKFSSDEIEIIRSSNKSYRAISKEFGCSIGLVSKIKRG